VKTLSFTNVFDTAGRLLTVSSNWSDGVHPTTLFSAQSASSGQCTQSSTPYAAFGGLMSAQFGNGLTLSRNYDMRFHPTCEIDQGGVVSSPTSDSTAITITGTEQSQ
jgi:hypothetical protein